MKSKDKDANFEPLESHSSNFEEHDILTYEESEIRLITLGIISSLALLTCSTAFMSITIRISGYYKDPVVLHYKDKESIGFPDPKILLVNYSGDYTIYSPIFNTLEKLPNLNRIVKAKKVLDLNQFEYADYEFERYKIHAAEYKNNLYFMYSDQSSNVIKYDLYTKKHRVINNTPSAKSHMGECSGIQIGKYFWIILGEDTKKNSFFGTDSRFQYLYGDLRPQLQSSIWSFEKERWFEGPSLYGLPGINPDINPDTCIVSVGRNTAYFLVDVYLLSYNFDTVQWTNHSRMQFWEFNTQFDWNSLAFPTCVFYQDKLYRRYIYVSGVVNAKKVNHTSLHWEIMRYSIDTDTWVYVSKYTDTEKYGGLTTQFQDHLIQILSSETFANFEITKITTENYEQEMLLKQNTVEFAPLQKGPGTLDKVGKQYSYTLTVFHKRNYIQEDLKEK